MFFDNGFGAEGSSAVEAIREQRSLPYQMSELFTCAKHAHLAALRRLLFFRTLTTLELRTPCQSALPNPSQLLEANP